MRAYDPSADEDLLNRAYVYAVRMHGAQKRASGDPYFAHPIEVAGILTEYRLDTATIVTALLHDVIEDTDVSRADVDRLFGQEVGELVEGVTKLSRLETTADYRRQAENLRKFILAVSRDVRVLLVKLADRLHNMRTLHFIGSAAKRERIARETLDIYAPLARSIGCHRICTELEELAFTHLNPVARDAILRRLDGLRAKQGKWVALASEEVAEKLKAAGIPARVVGREKTAFSIWRKLQRKSIGFARLSDIYAFRVIVDTEDDCYRALGVIHRAWPGVPERFKDFISTPKRNNYRSLHTTVVGPHAMRIEMQIRTEAMDLVAEQGVAAHWRYKNEEYAFDPEAAAAAGGADPLADVRQWVQVLDQGGDAEDLLEHAQMDVFLDQVFVFTPKGRLISLPAGAMPLDFAYAVHTKLGDTCLGAKINGELRPLRTALSNGDVVEVVRGAAPAVPPDWQALTVSARARSAIRRHLRHSEKEEFQRLGRAALDQTFERAGKARADISLRPALDRFAAATESELLEAVGRGRIAPTQVLETVFPGLKETEKEAASARRRIEDGEEARFWVRGDVDHGGFLALLGMLQPHARRPHRRHRGRQGRDGRPHHRLRPPRRLRGPPGAVAQPAVDGRSGAQHPLPGAPPRHHPRCAGRAGAGLHGHRRSWRQHRRHRHAPPPFRLLRRGFRRGGPRRASSDAHRRRPAHLPERGDRGPRQRVRGGPTSPRLAAAGGKKTGYGSDDIVIMQF